MRRRVRASEKFGRVRAKSGWVRRSGARRTRRGRRISAARAARLLTRMFQLGHTLETAMRPLLLRPQLQPRDEGHRRAPAPEPH